MPHTEIKFKHRVEYGAVLFLEWIFRVLPYHLGILFAWLLARFAFSVLRFRRREAERRIRSVFPDMKQREVSRTAWISLRNIALNGAELMGIGRLSDSWIRRRYISGYDETMAHLRSLTESGTGVILALPHLGNWDLAGIIVAHAGIPIFAISGSQKNPLTNDWINRKRAKGITVLERGSSAIRQCVKRLRGGEVMAVLPDVRMKQPDLLVPFLGGEANIGRGVAAFAVQTGAPVLVVRLRRIGLFHHTMGIADTIRPESGSAKDPGESERITRRVMSLIDSQIREEPGQWFWYNKRWILDPLQ